MKHRSLGITRLRRNGSWLYTEHCTCGFKAKARSRETVLAAFDEHQVESAEEE